MWKTLAKSVPGTSHRRTDTPCQDSCMANVCEVAGEQILILAVSDGAGSATHSDTGSRIACEAVFRAVSNDFSQPGAMPMVTRERAIDWYKSVLSELEKASVAASVEIRQLACTLLVAVITKSGSAFCQLGDGAIVVKNEGDYEHVFWPQSGEYVNTTNFVTAGRFEKELMFEWRNGPTGEIALFTDGLQTVALDFANRKAHGPFFSPLFDAIRNRPNVTDLEGPMHAFLESSQLAERTDDDITLILATRNASDDAIL